MLEFARPHPEQRGGFVGRTRELARLRELVAARRVVSVVGPPGAGKTRLVREALCVDEEASFVDLTDARTSDDVLVKVAVALDVSVQPTATAEKRLAHLGAALEGQARPLVLVLDNAEHVADAVRTIVDAWTEATRRAHFVVTSRIHLDCTGECVFELGALAFCDAQAPREQVESCDGVQLFVERARRALVDFDLDAHNYEDVARLVARLDGLPLAIELAAYRMNLMDPATMLARLDRAGPVLGRTHSGDGRYRTLQQAIAWSWELLDEPEKRALAQCSVFEAPFDVLAAEEVVALEDAVVLDVLQRLRNQSLIVSERDEGGRLELRLLLSIRNFAAQKLREQGEEQAVRQRLARCYAARCRDLLPKVDRLDPVESLDALRAIRPHLRSVVETAVASPEVYDLEDALTCAIAFSEVARLEGGQAQWLPTARMLVRLAKDGQPSARVLELEIQRARMLIELNRFHEGLAVLDAVMEQTETAGFEETFARAALEAAFAAIFVDQIERSQRLMAEVQARDVSEVLRGRLHLQRAGLFHNLGRRAEAREEYERALALSRACGDNRTEARVLHNLGIFFTDESSLELGRRYLGEALERHRRHGDRFRQAWAENSLGVLELRAHREQDGIAALHRALELFERQGMRSGAASVLANLGMIAIDFERYEDARAYATRALAVGNFEEDIYVRASARLCAAMSNWFLGDRAEARRMLEGGRDDLARASHIQLRISYLAALGGLLANEGEVEEAHRTLESAKSVLAEAGGDEVLEEMLAIVHGHFRIGTYRDRKLEGDISGANAALLELVEDLVHWTVSAFEATQRSEPLRYSVRLLTREMPPEGRRLLEAERQDPDRLALLVDEEMGLIRGPTCAWTDLSRSPSLWRMFVGLLTHRLQAPGEVLDVEALREIVWPGEAMTPDSAANRLYVSVSKLRKAGLKKVLLRADDGYLLDPDVAIVRTTEA